MERVVVIVDENAGSSDGIPKKEEEEVSTSLSIEEDEEKSYKKLIAGESSLPSTSQGAAMFDCRYCLLPDTPSNLIAPCGCDGTLHYCHYKCLQSWVKEKRSMSCEICNREWNGDVRSKLAKVVAEKNEEEARDGELSTRLGDIVLVVDDQVTVQHRHGLRLCVDRLRILLLVIFTTGLLYIVLFLSKDSNFSNWTVMLLRVLSFILPFYLIGRGIMALQRYRQERGFID